MNNKNMALAVFGFICVVCAYHAYHYSPLLPDIVAYNFDGAGKPQTWGSKSGFITIYMVTVGGLAVIFSGTVFALAKLPVSMINVPKKGYWLSPERRQETRDYISSSLLWFGSFSMLLLLDIFHQCFRVHTGQTDRLEHMWLSLSGYFLITVIWCVTSVYRFYGKAP